MEKYSGDEANLPLNFWEELRPLTKDCETSKLTEEYIHSICTRLFRAKGGKYSEPDYFKKNFQIIVEDSPQIQASYTASKFTRDRRNILRVSKGLIDAVDTEAQLASVIAHELGHFQVDETTSTDSRNESISLRENEKTADYYGFKSMVEAGYNPDAIIEFFKIIDDAPRELSAAYEEANDEHGSTRGRIALAKDYKSAYERQGYVFGTDEGIDRFDAFMAKYVRVQENDKYIGYLESRFREEYNLPSSSEATIQQRWDFCEKILDTSAEDIRYRSRIEEFKTMMQMGVHSISKEQAPQINRILEKSQKLAKTYSLSEVWCCSDFPHRDVDGDVYMKPVGDTAVRTKIMKNLIENPEELRSLVENQSIVALNKEFLFNTYQEEFVEFPQYSVEGMQKGDTVPWAIVSQITDVKNMKEVQTLMEHLGVEYDYFEQKYGDSLGSLSKDPNAVFCDAKGVIQSTDPEEVERLRVKSKQETARNSLDGRKLDMQKQMDDLYATMALNPRGSAEHEAAKARAIELYDYGRDAFTPLDNSKDFFLEVSQNGAILFSKKDAERPSAQLLMPDLAEKEDNRFYPVSRFTLDGKSEELYAKNFFPADIEVILSAELQRAQNMYPIERENRLDTVLKAVGHKYTDKLRVGNSQREIADQAVRNAAPALFDAYDKMMGQYIGDKGAGRMHSMLAQTLVVEHIGRNGNLPYLDKFLQKRNITPAHNTDELVHNLGEMPLKNTEDFSQRGLISYTKLIRDYEVVRTINSGVNIDMPRVLEALEEGASPDLANSLTEYAQKHELFSAKEGETAEETYQRCKDLYVNMSVKGAFSSENAYQQQAEKQLITYMQQLSPERQTQEARSLLLYNRKSETIRANMDKHLGIREKIELDNQAERLKVLNGSILQYDSHKKIAENIYVQSFVTSHGKDDQTPAYQEQVLGDLRQMSSEFPRKSRQRICHDVSLGIEAQKDLAFAIKDVQDKRDIDYEAQDKGLQGYNLMEVHLQRNPQFAEQTMEFLLSQGTSKDCMQFSQAVAKEYNTSKYMIPEAWTQQLQDKLDEHKVDSITAQDIQDMEIPENFMFAEASKMYEEYKNAGFEERALIMHRLLDAYASQSGKNYVPLSNEQKLEKQISYVSGKIFGNQETDKELLEDVKTVATAICHQEEQPSLLLGGVLSGREPGQSDESMNIGDGLTMFCEKQGTAWVKMGQTLSYVDAVRPDIRKSLEKLKDKANPPPREGIFKDLIEGMPESEFGRIKHVNQFIGGGTFGRTFSVDILNDETQAVETKVVQVMHDRADVKSKREFGKINGAIDELCQKDPKFEILRSVAERSAKNAAIEVDIHAGAKQYENACRNYGRIKEVELNGVSFVPKVATWERYGKSRFSNYKVMEMAPGKSIDSPEFSAEQKRMMALAYTTIEATALLGGKEWDIDRHSKQQNFNITKDKNGKPVVEIGIFDTGAQRPAPTRTEKKMLGKFLIAVAKEQQKGGSAGMGEIMLNKIKKFEKAGKDVNYVSDVQRGLLALSDVMKYMETPEHPNGIAEGLSTCFKSLKENHLIDEGLYRALVKQVGVEMLKSPSFARKTIHMVMNPISGTDKLKIHLGENDEQIEKQIRNSININKAESETDKLEAEKTKIITKPKELTEQVKDTLEEMGVDKNSYMLFDSRFHKHIRTEYGTNESRSIEGYFDCPDAEKYPQYNIFMGQNNGTTALYFAKQKIYVVSPDPDFKRKVLESHKCKDVGLACMFSNGEKIIGVEMLNKDWEDMKKRAQERERNEERERIQKLRGIDGTISHAVSQEEIRAMEQTLAPEQNQTAPQAQVQTQLQTPKEEQRPPQTPQQGAVAKVDEDTKKKNIELVMKARGVRSVKSQTPVQQTKVDLSKQIKVQKQGGRE